MTRRTTIFYRWIAIVAGFAALGIRRWGSAATVAASTEGAAA